MKFKILNEKEIVFGETINKTNMIIEIDLLTQKSTIRESYNNFDSYSEVYELLFKNEKNLNLIISLLKEKRLKKIFSNPTTLLDEEDNMNIIFLTCIIKKLKELKGKK